MTAGDARRAVAAGADGIVVSNHGGRQLDGVAATLRVLPGIAEAVKGKTTIFLDSGIRRGADIAKAIVVHPILLQRPVVVSGKKAAIGRPPALHPRAHGLFGRDERIDQLPADAEQVKAYVRAFVKA